MSGGKDYSRREFMSKPLVYLASAGLLSASGKLWGEEAVLTENAPNPGKVIQRRLGRTGVKLPVVSMGVMNADIPGLLVRAYELGVRHFDTAAGYQGGRNEEMVGNFVKEHGVRDKVVIATKIGLPPQVREDAAQAKAQFLKVFEGCLQRLQMDYVDILYFHGIDNAADVNAPGVQEAMADLKKQGKIRFPGVSTHSGQTEVLNAVAQGGFHDVVLVAINFTMSENKPLLEAIKNAAAKGVGLIAMKTQAGGQWYRGLRFCTRSSRSPSATPPRSSGCCRTKPSPRRFRASPSSNRSNWTSPWPQISNYTPEEKQFLADKSLKASLEFCQQCGECVPSCPYHVDIPTLMRTHMYARQYGNSYQARVTLAEVPKGSGLDVCRSCTSCRASCTNTVNIARKISELKTIQLA